MEVANQFKKQAIDAVLALGTVKAMLLDENHVNNVDTQEFIDDVSVNQIASANYTAGGLALVNPTSARDDANNRVILDANDPAWIELTATIGAVVYYVDTGTPATSPIISMQKFAQDQVLNAQDFTINLPTTGILVGS